MNIYRKIFSFSLLAVAGICAVAQVENGGVVRRRSDKEKKNEKTSAGVTDRMQDFYTTKETHDADIQYKRDIYREIDLSKPENTPLYYPEDVVDGKQNLFRLMFGLVVDGKIPAYEYLDGREVFTDQYKIKVDEMLDRYEIYYQNGNGTAKSPKYIIEEADVPTNQVLAYYILEKWEFDRRTNRMKTRVEAICPVLNKYTDYGAQGRYPMFWVKFDQLRPWLAQEYVFLSDDNNLEQYSLDDYFNLGMYQGDIYKTRNLRNLSMAQLYPDDDLLKQAQDSIDNRLKNYGKNLYVPTREEYLAQKEREEEIARAIAAGDTIPGRTVMTDNDSKGDSEKKTVRSRRSSTAKAKKAPKAKKPKLSSSSSSSNGNASAAKSVRRRKK
ncbi:MAG: gliding motility protein GldN [Muribaculaceae bacterium]|nr:gliding motility protein GldN [Muribaculaceae bacterium]